MASPHVAAAALRACWHPVAYATEVGAAPRATTLLDEPLVLWRDRSGVVRAFRDVCVHRGTALSLGRVEGDEIVCAYHGWRYRGDGACTAIPQLAEPTRAPARARAVAYPVTERHGIVWVALEPPRWPIPERAPPHLRRRGRRLSSCHARARAGLSGRPRGAPTRA
jgi:phenylpropionate dioxygenase-like ring-hydroxylating dioxygenase large terminal subunit